MASGESPNLISLQYPTHTEKRAEIALCCSPFNLNLFVTMSYQSVRLKSIASDAGFKNAYTVSLLSELAAENYLLWLIQVGVLRREVDGQGITDSFRLTPLGHQLVKKYAGKENWPQPTISDRLDNLINRWFRLPV
ncbi:Npun_F0494 family protein [Dapis sp. BLCC M126]|uniref:Npun_F0494 family protein n=1 Tax=Dapis sp. BLCC M126 TaxID=3400189 RepID=UPI003CF0EB40